MKGKQICGVLLALAIAPALAGCGFETVDGAVYSDYNPFGSSIYGPSWYYDNNVPYAGPTNFYPSRPVFGYPTWTSPATRPYPGPVNPAPSRPHPNPGVPNPGMPNPGPVSPGSGLRPGANITHSGPVR